MEVIIEDNKKSGAESYISIVEELANQKIYVCCGYPSISKTDKNPRRFRKKIIKFGTHHTFHQKRAYLCRGLMRPGNHIVNYKDTWLVSNAK